MNIRVALVGLSTVILLALAAILFRADSRSAASPALPPRVRAQAPPAALGALVERNAVESVRAPEGDAAPAAAARQLSLREVFLEIAAAEEALLQASEADPNAVDPELAARLETALSLIVDDPDQLHRTLGFLAPGPDGEPQLSAREQYGAIRAVYWSMVIASGRGDGRPTVLAVLSVLPTIHDAAREQLLANITQAAVDGVLVLDSSYLEDILYLRSQYPENKQLFSALFAVMGESLTPEERHALFSVFQSETDDPLLAGLTIKNLLLGSDAEFGLFLAKQRFDSDELSPETKRAIASAVVENADVFSATSFLVERTDSFRNDLALWTALGGRPGGQEALEAEYFGLVGDNANPRAREMIVTGMRDAPTEDLLRIARTDSEPRVAGQALMTATARAGSSSPEQNAATLQLLRESYRPGGIGAAQALGIASNLARNSRTSGDKRSRDSAVDFMLDLARDPGASPSNRRQAIQMLRPFLAKYEIEGLEQEL